MNKLAAVFKLTRIEHSLLSAVAVVAAELIAKGLPSLPILILSLISPVLLNMTAFAINDYFDVEVDKLNKKKRPLVTGDLSKREAVYVTGVTLVLGIVASIFINPICFAIALVFGIFDILYSYKLKEILLVGNAYVALSMAIAFVYGSYVVVPTPSIGILLVTLLVFLSGLAREIHGTIRDYDGDVRARNAHTLPKSIGKAGAAVVAFLLYLASVALSVYLFLRVAPFKYNLAFGMPFVLADIMLLYAGYVFLAKTKKSDYDRTRNISLGAMAIAILGLLIAPLVFV